MKSILQVFTFDLVSKAILGVTGVLVIRLMAPGEYARYTLAIAVAGFAGQVLATAVNRVYIVGRDRLSEEDPLHAVLGFQLLMVAGGTVLAAPALIREPVLGALVAALTTAMCLSEFAKTYFQRDLRFRAFSAVEVGRSVAFMAAVLLGAFVAGARLQAWHVILLQAVTFLTAFAVAIGRQLRWRAVLRPGQAISVLSVIMRTSYRDLFLYFTLLSLLSQVSIGMLGLAADSLALASYGSAFRYYALLMMGLAAVDKVLLPLVQAADSTDAIRGVLLNTRKIALGVAGPVLIAAWLARWALPVIDKGKYPDAVPAFQILAVSAILSLLLSPYANVLLKHEEFRPLLWLAGISVLINVTLAVPFIRAWGAPGAAAAYAIGYTVLQAGSFLRARAYLREPTPSAPGDPLLVSPLQTR